MEKLYSWAVAAGEVLLSISLAATVVLTAILAAWNVYDRIKGKSQQDQTADRVRIAEAEAQKEQAKAKQLEKQIELKKLEQDK